MKIQYLSDLHLYEEDMEDLDVIEQQGEILVLAGDICDFSKYETLLYSHELFQKYHHVIIVPGNHEYYHSNVVFIQPRKVQVKNITVLNNDTFQIGNLNFIGTTLWSEINPMDYLIIRTQINDFTYIKGLNDETFNQFHIDSVKFIKENIREGMINIVVSHHLPSYRIISQKFKGNSLNPAFASNCFHKLEKKPQYWIHGHSHEYDYTEMDGCILTRNPIGFYHEARHFNLRNQKLLDIP